MKRLPVMICMCALVALVGGCARPAAEDRFLSHWEKIVSLVSENKTDMAKADAAVRQYLNDNLADMKTLAAEFGKDKDKKFVEDSDFVGRVLGVIDSINALRISQPALFENSGLAETLAPLNDIVR